MGSVPRQAAHYEAAVHSPTLQAVRLFDHVVKAVVWIAETVTKAPDDEYALGTVRDPRGVLVAAADSEGRTWTQDDGPASQIAQWRHQSKHHVRFPSRRQLGGGVA